MFISCHWLRELTGTILTPRELRDGLTMVGLAIDAVAEVGDDYVLDVEVPSNRPDCLSHVGIAREVSVIDGGQVIMPPANPPSMAGKASGYAAVDVFDPDLCPRYTARVVRGVKIAPSPTWLAKRLETIGQRPINNVADITNYVLHELGQPLHAFDLAKLSEGRIIVRRAGAGEKIKTLDGVDRELKTDMLVIADATSPVAIAGVMGGEYSEISDTTVDVLIESAYFDPDSVRRTARALGMDTEASRRFERGSDYGGVLQAQARCIELICEIAGGAATEDAIDVCTDLPPARLISFRPARVETLTSLHVAPDEINRILLALGFVISPTASVVSSAETTFVVPTWRVDVEREEDLIEEVARHTGYDQIGSELPPARSAGEYQPQETKRRVMRRALTASGFAEAINFSFIDTAHDDRIELIPAFAGVTGIEQFVTLQNPIIDDAVRMRPTLIPGLLDSLRRNFNHGEKNVRLFENGRIFASSAAGQLPYEREALALAITGGATEEDRAQAARELDFYDLTGAIAAAAEAMKLGPIYFAKATIKHLRAGQAAAIKLADGRVIGAVGRLAETVAALYKFRQPVYVGELDLSMLLATKEKETQYRPLARYPGVVRDVTLQVDRHETLAEMLEAIACEKNEFCRSAKLVGIFQGASVPDGKRAVTLRLEYRSDDRTLRDDEVEEMHRAIVNAIAQKVGAELH
jgi:phenylalanyl-tRNA synthetase beta chain